MQPLLDKVRRFHEVLPERIRRYLKRRGISDQVIDFHLLGWDGKRIAIPIRDRDGRVVFVKRAKDPDDTGSGPKMLCPVGAHAELYGWERVVPPPPRIVICEGEFDRLVLESHGIAAVTSTGGARVFRPEWAEVFEPIDEVSVCYDRDEAGRAGAQRVADLIPKARLVDLSEDVGEGGDVTDFFVRLRKTREDFLALLDAARPVPPRAAGREPRSRRLRNAPWAERVERLKRDVAIVDLVREYVRLEPLGERLTGRCPFHIDRDPSFVVFPSQDRFHCFGCGADGDVITFIMMTEHLTFREALDALEDRILDHGRGTQAVG